MQAIEKAYKAWSSGATLRERRRRHINYTYGDQWCDLVRDKSGKLVREDAAMASENIKPLKNNLIRQMVKTIVGRYRTQAAEAAAYSGKGIGPLARANSLAELDSRLLEEFLISGCAIQRICHERRCQGMGTWVENVDLPRIFVNPFRDPRGWDINLIGMLHDMSGAEIVNRFAGGSESRARELLQLFGGLGAGATLAAGIDLGGGFDAGDFFSGSDDERFRVIEMWSFDSRPGADGTNATLDFAWHCRWMAPDGTILSEYDSPFPHGSHPFVLKFHPLTGGEVHSFVEDVIDQQKYINRLIVIIDRMLATSAKGVLLYPRAQMPDDCTWEHISNVWARADGVLPIKGTPGPLPQQVVTNTSGSGAYQLLDLQMKLFEDIAGVGDALLGRSNGSARGVEMFDTQVRNATIALADIFDTFTAFTQERNDKALAMAAAQ